MNQLALERLCTKLLYEIGEDPLREGLKDTPARWARWWSEFIDYDPGNTESTFEAITTDQMVVVRGLRVWSLCEHHLLPFWSDVSVGYITRDHVLGLSKFARIAHQAAHKLQLQERMTHEIADKVQSLTGSDDVAVLCKGTHLCMVMRGIKTHGEMITSVTRGIFREDPRARAEFFSLLT